MKKNTLQLITGCIICAIIFWYIGLSPAFAAWGGLFNKTRKANESNQMDKAEKAVILAENFDGATTDTFFTAGYKAAGKSGDVAMYFKSGGVVQIDTGTYGSGVLALGGEQGGRFLIGCKTPEKLTTASDKAVNGLLDLSKPYQLSFKVMGAAGIKTKKMIISVNNNTTLAKNSLYGEKSKIYASSLRSLKVGKIYVINSTVGDANSFIQLRIESDAGIVIDDLVIKWR